MAFSQQYPELAQWLTHGGLLHIRQVRESATGIEAILGDAGGFPYDGGCTAPTIDELFAVVEAKAGHWRVLNAGHLRDFISEPFEDWSGTVRDLPEIRFTGWPAIPNPFYDPENIDSQTEES